ncbi:thioredoxin domain-containing protein [candidate division WWE3 bacterium]|uniref:Thioredoxin domain-containing protein n=1 Tax=candidate division WWE3 bacterium TaxID=2053526 RepID=A0A7X9DKL5_UNCKA|nr:thioredoxin domain-containing protein [candidate division WWE3 bacterium]
MKEFIIRNKPVFVIAVITIVIFVSIIILAQNTTTIKPNLRKIENVDLISSHTYKKGPINPKVTLVEFSDFQCPACRSFHPVLVQISDKYKKDLQLAYRNFPLPQHENAKLAAIAAQAAGSQGKFWEYADLLYNNQDSLKKDDLIKYAETAGMNVEQFKKDIEDNTFAAQVEDDMRLGNQIGVNSTPTLILNNIVMEFGNVDEFETQVIEAIKNAGGNINQDSGNETTDSEKQTTSSFKQDVKGIVPSADVVTIEYTKDGFVPNNLKLTLGQRVKFINNTDKEISIQQLIKKYDFFYSPKVLGSKEEFEFTLTEPDLWTFKEASVRHYGSIFVSKEN